MATRNELVAAVGQRYARADRAQRGRILDEFTQLAGFHRKHAARLLRDGRADGRGGPRCGRRVYDEAVREALMVLWEASGRVCGKRLRPLLPVLVEAMERHGHLQLAADVRSGLLAMSAATIDRALREKRGLPEGGRRRRHAPSAIRRGIAVRTFDGWD
ncbi:MAG: ISNCY family transposase, partial [Acetobacteraceae bacterium]|nr:ISNCY family transposase [Acetobacteraceae bacterium]